MVLSMHPHAIAANGEDCLYMQDTWLVTADGGVPLADLEMEIWASGVRPEAGDGGPPAATGYTGGVTWPWIVLLAIGVGVVVAAEWPRFERLAGADARRLREREKRKAKLTGDLDATTTSSSAASRPTSRRCRRSRSARRPAKSGKRAATGSSRARLQPRATGSRSRPTARACWAGSAARSPCCATPGSRTPGAGAGACRA